MNVTDKICSDCCVYTHSKIQIIISHLLALLAAQILPRHTPGLLFNVSITTGKENCVLLQLYLVNESLLFFFPYGSHAVPSTVFLGVGNAGKWFGLDPSVPKYGLHGSTFVANPI